MGCGCGGATWTPPTEAELASPRAAKRGARPTQQPAAPNMVSGPRSPGFFWNGPGHQAEAAAANGPHA